MSTEHTTPTEKPGGMTMDDELRTPDEWRAVIDAEMAAVKRADRAATAYRHRMIRALAAPLDALAFQRFGKSLADLTEEEGAQFEAEVADALGGQPSP